MITPEIQSLLDGKRMRQCGRCRKVLYCSKECQKVHWKEAHKHECGAATKSSFLLNERKKEIMQKGVLEPLEEIE